MNLSSGHSWFALALPWLRDALTAATVVCAAGVCASLGYCLFLLAVAAAAKRETSPARDAAPSTRFCILIPAHDEELVLASTLDELTRLDYPAALRKIVVIADNCTDATAQIASEYDGIRVLERRNASERGKGHALNWALQQSLPGNEFDAYVIVDADTHVDPRFLSAMESAMRAQAEQSQEQSPYFAAQGRYDVLNEDEGWRTALMAGALALAHVVRPLARERLGLTVGLKGNGMCFSTATLRAVSWSASLTEDIDFAMDLIETLNLPVHYVPEAVVAAQMPNTEQASRSQRDRWERGRFEILRRRGWRMLGAGLRERNGLKLDAAFDLIVPPLAEMAAGLVVWAGLLALNSLLGQDVRVSAFVWGTAALLLFVYIFAGFAVGGAPKRAYSALLCAPGYVAWKLVLRLFPKRGKGGDEGTGGGAWVRTERTAIPATGSDAQTVPGAAE